MFTEVRKQHFPISATYFHVKDLYSRDTYNHASADMVTFTKIDYSNLGWHLWRCSVKIVRLKILQNQRKTAVPEPFLINWQGRSTNILK